MTYAISSALKRYESGTATSPALRAAWIVGEHLERVRAAPDQAVAPLDAERAERRARAVHLGVEIGERRRRGRRAAEVVDDDGRSVTVRLGV